MYYSLFLKFLYISQLYKKNGTTKFISIFFKVELVQNKFVIRMVSPKHVKEYLIIAKGYLIVSSNMTLNLDLIIENCEYLIKLYGS